MLANGDQYSSVFMILFVFLDERDCNYKKE